MATQPSKIKITQSLFSGIRSSFFSVKMESKGMFFAKVEIILYKRIAKSKLNYLCTRK